MIQLLNFPDLVIILGVLAKLGEAAIGFSYQSVHPSSYNNRASIRFSEDLVVRVCKICLKMFGLK